MSTTQHPRPSDPARPGGAFQIGQVAGVPLYVASSWFFGALLLVGFFALQGNSMFASAVQTVAFSVAIVLGLFFSVGVHELAHALVARAFGYRVLNITFSFWGGATRYVAYQPRAFAAAVIAVAGPLANFALAGLGFGLTVVLPDGGLALVGTAFTMVNLLLGIYNILPGLPLDGGQVTSGIAWGITRNHTTGIFVGAWAGRVIVVLVAIYFVLSQVSSGGMFGILWTIMITVMLWQSTSAQLAVAHQRRELDRLTVGTVARPAILLPDSMPAQLAMAYAQPGRAFILHNGDKVTGVITGFPVHCPAPLDPVRNLALPVQSAPFECPATTPVTDFAIAMQAEQRPAIVLRLPDGDGRVLLLDDILMTAARQSPTA